MKKNIKIIIIFLIFNIMVAISPNVFAYSEYIDILVNGNPTGIQETTAEDYIIELMEKIDSMTAEELKSISDEQLEEYYEDIYYIAGSSYLNNWHNVDSYNLNNVRTILYKEINRREVENTSIEELISDINSRSFKEMKSLTVSETVKYQTILEGAKNRTDIDTGTLEKAINRLKMERIRARNGWFITPYEINIMSQREINSLSVDEKNKSIEILQQLYDSKSLGLEENGIYKSDISAAINKLLDNTDSLSAKVINNMIADINNMTDREIADMPRKDIEYYLDIFTNKVQGVYGINAQDLQRAKMRLMNELENRGESFDYRDYEPDQIGGSTKLQSIAGNILAIIRNIGIVVSIISITILGVKYMVGSVEQKAEYKKSMVPFVIGLIIFTTATTLISAIYDAVTNILG